MRNFKDVEQETSPGGINWIGIIRKYGKELGKVGHQNQCSLFQKRTLLEFSKDSVFPERGDEL